MLEFEPEPLCIYEFMKRWRLYRMHLKAGADTCSLDSYSQRCCSLWGKPYEVLAQGAAKHVLGANVEIRAAGFLVPAP